MQYKTIFCYGDSNTYGYDPNAALGDRYGEEDRWCEILGEKLGCRTLNYGEDGRTIPINEWSYGDFQCALARETPDVLLVMLGTNDVIMQNASPERVTERMEAFLKKTRKDFPNLPVVLMSPPTLTYRGYTNAMREVSRLYGQLARRMHVDFVDTFQWDIPLACDEVHFTAAGHHLFAEKLVDSLYNALNGNT